MISDVVTEIHDLGVEASLDKNYAKWEREIIRELSSQTQLALGQLERVERSLEKGTNPPSIETIKGWFHRSIVELQAIPALLAEFPVGVSFGRGIAGCLNKIWGTTLVAIGETIVQPYKDSLGIENWSVGVTGGFPLGLSTTFTITFK